MLLYPVGENFIHISVQGCHLAIMHDNPLKQSSAAFLAPGTVFGEDSFHGQGWGLFGDDSSTLQRRQWHPSPVLSPGKSYGQRSLVGCSPWGHTESDTTEAT